MPLRNLRLIFSADLAFPTDLADRFAWIVVSWVAGLARARDMWNAEPDPLLARVQAVLRRRATRFAALMAHYRAGTLPPPGCRRGPAGQGGASSVGAAEPDPTGSDAAAGAGGFTRGPSGCQPSDGGTPASRRLPRGRGWLTRMVPDAWMQGAWLREFLDEPKMVAFLAACPQARAMVRSTLHALSFDPLPPVLRPDVRPCPFVHAIAAVDVSRYVEARARTPDDPQEQSGARGRRLAVTPAPALKFWPA